MDSFANTSSELYDENFPIKLMQRKRLKTIHNPWFTKGLLKSIRKRAKLYKKFLKNPNIGNEKVYKIFKNKLNHLIRIAKRNYYDQKLETLK